MRYASLGVASERCGSHATLGPCFAKVAKLMLRKGKGTLHCIGKVYYTGERSCKE